VQVWMFGSILRMMRVKSKRKWHVSGYIARSRDGSLALVCIFSPEGEKTYHIAPIRDVIDCLTGKRGYVKLRKRS